jgi:hypothetical protein
MLLRNIGICLPDYTMSEPRIPQCERSPTRKPQKICYEIQLIKQFCVLRDLLVLSRVIVNTCCLLYRRNECHGRMGMNLALHLLSLGLKSHRETYFLAKIFHCFLRKSR